MSVFKTDLMKSEVACAGVRGLQRMRRSRSTSSIGRTEGKVRHAREFLCKQPCESRGIGTMLLKSTIGSLGLDLMLPPMRGSLGLDLMLPPMRGNAKANNVYETCHPLASNDSAKCIRTIIQAPQKQKVARTAPNVWVPVVELPGSVESTPGAWRSFCKEICSYEEVFAMTGETQEPQSNPGVADACRYYFCHPIQFYEEICFLTGCDEAVLIDDEVLALRRPQTQARHYLFCREIHSYEEILSVFGEAYIEFDDKFTVSARSENEGENARDTCWHFFGRPIESYEEMHSLVGTCTFVLDESLWTTRAAARSFYCKDISSYEELLSLVSNNDALLDDECSPQTATNADLVAKKQVSFYCRSISSYEELHSLLPDGPWEFDHSQSQ